MTHLKLTALALAVGLAISPIAAHAQAATPEDVQKRLQQLEMLVQQQQDEIRSLRSNVDAMQLEQTRGRGVSAPGDGTQDMPQTAGTTPRQGQVIGQAQQAQAQEEQREQDKKLVVREHAPLFKRALTLDVGGSYSYYDRRQLSLSGFLALDAIFLGAIDIDQSKASVYTVDATGRYGLSDRWSVEANVPMVYRRTSFTSGGAGGASSKLSEATASASGVGDASLATYYQLIRENASHPDVVASLRIKIPTGKKPFGIKLVQPDKDNSNLAIPETLPTGSGMYSAQMGVSVLRTYDPVILFGNASYTYNFSRSFDDISPVKDQKVPGRVWLGNTLQLSGGLAIALNDRSAVSFALATAFSAATHTQAKGDLKSRVVGSPANAATFVVGGTYLLPSGWTWSGQLSMGLTPDAPNYAFSLRASHTF